MTTRQIDGLADRVRRLRIERGLSQTELASPGYSASYISLIESGKRQPSAAVIDDLAARLGSSPGFLADGIVESQAQSVELNLRYAEIALRTGDAEDAHNRIQELIDDDRWPEPRHRVRALFLRGCANESLGDLEAGIRDFEQVRGELGSDGDALWLPTVIALARCHREVGDLAHAVEIGQSAHDRLAGLKLLGTEESIQLAATLVAAYFERGDVVKARLLAARVIKFAEQNGSPRARGAAYWNASLVEGNRGRVGEAIRLAERALALFGEGDDARNLARLRIAYAWLLLRHRPPDVDRALGLLNKSNVELRETGSTLDVAYGLTELARAREFLGEPSTARELVVEALGLLDDGLRVQRAQALLVLGACEADLGEEDAAAECLRQARDALSASAESRFAATIWRGLGDELERHGQAREALTAYRKAMDTGGIPTEAVTRSLFATGHPVLSSEPSRVDLARLVRDTPGNAPKRA